MEFVLDEDTLTTDSDDSNESEDGPIGFLSNIRGLIVNGRRRNKVMGLANSRNCELKFKFNSDTAKLVKSEFSLQTKIASGSGSMKRKWPRDNITSMVVGRENGLPYANKFSNADKCKINNEYLPNKMELLENHRGKVFCGIFSKDGDYFVTAAQDRQIIIFDSKTVPYREVNRIHANEIEWSIIDVAISPSKEQVVYSTWSTSLKLCSLDDSCEKQEVLSLTNIYAPFCAFCVAYSSSGNEILAGANDGCVYFYDLEKHQCILRINAHDIDANAVTFATESSQIIYSGGDDGLIKVWDRRTLNEDNPKEVGTLAGHLDGITYIDSRGDGRYLISNSKDQSIKLWDIRAFSSNQTVRTTVKVVREQLWDYRWQNVPRAMYEERLIEGDTSIMTYRGHSVTKTLVRCRFSPLTTTGQRYIYTGCGLGHVVIYDALTGQVVQRLTGHSSTVRDVSWHPYRTEILSCGWDGLIGFSKYTKFYYRYGQEMDMDDESSLFPQKIRRSQRLADKQQNGRN